MNLVALATPVLAVLLLLAAHASAFLTLPGTLGCRLPLRETRRSPACGQRLGLKELSMTAHGAVTTTAGERDDMATAEGPVEYTIMYPSGYAKASPGGVQGEGEIDALLFDCDGTLVDSMPMWTANWRETVELFGLSWDDEDFLYKHAGKTIEETLKILCDAQGKKVDADAFFAAKEENMATLFPHVKEIAPVADIARREGKRRMAVVSSGPRYMVEALLKQADMHHLFDFFICAEDVTEHKPSPVPYLEAAKKLGIPPSRCRVFEDADAGIAAGLSAGMQTVDVRNMAGYPK